MGVRRNEHGFVQRVYSHKRPRKLLYKEEEQEEEKSRNSKIGPVYTFIYIYRVKVYSEKWAEKCKNGCR